jgi:hypothetical protein
MLDNIINDCRKFTPSYYKLDGVNAFGNKELLSSV